MTDKVRSRNAPKFKGALNQLSKDIIKTHGEGIMRMASTKRDYTYISTGIFVLDLALLGGIAEELTTMVYGWPSGGKSTLSLKIAAEAQKKYKNGVVVWLDIEGTFDPLWAAANGVDNDRLVLIEPDHGEMALDIAIAAVEAPETCLVILDSIPALMPTVVMEASFEQQQMANHAKLVTKFLSKVQQTMLTQRRLKHRVSLLLINQWRSKVGFVMGDPRVLSGGNMINYLPAIKIEILNKEIMGKNQDGVEIVIHNEHKFKIGKNKTGNSLRTGEFKMLRDNYNDKGTAFIDEGQTVITYARKYGLISGGGSSWKVKDIVEPFRKLVDIEDYLYANAEFFTNLKRSIIELHRASMGLNSKVR